MTEVRLHGVLAKEFGSSFIFKVGRVKHIFRAIDANKKNFINRIIELSKQGLHYTMIVDHKKISDLSELEIKKEYAVVDLVPVILGSGVVAAALVGVAGMALMTGFAVAHAMWWVGLALVLVSMALTVMMAPKPDAGPPISATTKAFTDSFSFSNKANVAAQGTPVPIGYGRLKVGSQVVQFCVKSFPQSESSIDAMVSNPFNVVSEGSSTEPITISSRV